MTGRPTPDDRGTATAGLGQDLSWKLAVELDQLLGLLQASFSLLHRAMSPLRNCDLDRFCSSSGASIAFLHVLDVTRQLADAIPRHKIPGDVELSDLKAGHRHENCMRLSQPATQS